MSLLREPSCGGPEFSYMGKQYYNVSEQMACIGKYFQSRG